MFTMQQIERKERKERKRVQAYSEDVRVILKGTQTVQTLHRKDLQPNVSTSSHYYHFDLEQELNRKKNDQQNYLKRGKFVLCSFLGASAVTAIANIPQTALLSDAIELKDTHVQLNIMPDASNFAEYVQTGRFEKGDTLSTVFKRMDIQDLAAEKFIQNNVQARQVLLLPLGTKLIAKIDENKQLSELKTLIKANDERGLWLVIERRDNKFVVRKEFVENQREIQMRSGDIAGNFFSTMAKSGIPSNVAKQLIEIFGSTINFQHDIKAGDQFRIVFEKITNHGQTIGHGKILAAEIMNSSGGHQALWYPEKNEYYTFSGDSLKRSLLQNPLAYAKVTSNFGYRVHPVHGYSHQHTGIDFSAPTGTPVFASATGKVTFAGRQNGYGNIVIINHGLVDGKEVSTRYAHLSKFHQLNVGQNVKQGEIIAYSGATGTATAPHLHYEYRENGVAVNPLTALGDVVEPLTIAEKRNFMAYADVKIQQIAALRQFKVQHVAYKDDTILNTQLSNN